MAFQPISRTAVQYVDLNGNPYSGAVLKAYEAETTTPVVMATAADGVTTVSSVQLNASGYPEVSGSVITPYIDGAYKLALYPDQTAADSNTGAIFMLPAFSGALSFGEATFDISSSTTLTVAEYANSHINASGTITITLPSISLAGNTFVATILNRGTGVVTLDGSGADLLNGEATIDLDVGNSALIIASETGYALIGIQREYIELIDEDDMASDDETKAPSQQSVKAYINSQQPNQAYASNSTYTTLGTILPADGTVPQNTEGDEFLTLAFTPQTATSKLIISVSCHVGAANNVGMVGIALFKDSDTDALAASGEGIDSSIRTANVAFTYAMTSGTTSEITFKLRGGSDIATDAYLNGDASASSYGAANSSSIHILEII